MSWVSVTNIPHTRVKYNGDYNSVSGGVVLWAMKVHALSALKPNE